MLNSPGLLLEKEDNREHNNELSINSSDKKPADLSPDENSKSSEKDHLTYLFDDFPDDDLENSNLLIPDGNLTILSSIGKLLKISLPIMCSFTFSLSLVFIAILLGRLNNDEKHMAATTLITVIVNAVSTIPLIPLTAVGLLLSTKYGECKDELKKIKISKDNGNNNEDAMIVFQEKTMELKNYSKTGIMTALMFSIPPAITLGFYSKPFLVNLLGQDEEVAEISSQYLQIFSIAVPALGWRIIAENIIFVFRHEKIAAVVGIVDFSIGLLISCTLGFGYASIPKKNIEGVAIGFTSEGYLTAGVYTLYDMFKKGLKKYKFFRNWRLSKGDLVQLKEILRIGLPMMVTVGNELAAQVSINAMIGKLGTHELAAQNFMSQFTFIVYLPSIAFGYASSQEFGRNYGQKKYLDAQCTANSSLLTGTLLILPGVMLVSFYPEVLQFMIANKSGMNDLTKLLHQVAFISALGTMFDGLSFILLQELRAIQINLVPALFSIIGSWLGVTMGHLLGNNVGLQLRGMILGYTIGLFLRFSSLCILWKKKTSAQSLRLIDKNHAENDDNQTGLKYYSQKCQALLFCCSKKNRAQNEALLDVIESDIEPENNDHQPMQSTYHCQ